MKWLEAWRAVFSTEPIKEVPNPTMAECVQSMIKKVETPKERIFRSELDQALIKVIDRNMDLLAQAETPEQTLDILVVLQLTIETWEKLPRTYYYVN